MLVSRRSQMRGHGGNRVAGAHLRSLFLERRAPAVPPSARQLQRQTAGVVLRRLPWRGRRAAGSRQRSKAHHRSLEVEHRLFAVWVCSFWVLGRWPVPTAHWSRRHTGRAGYAWLWLRSASPPRRSCARVVRLALKMRAKGQGRVGKVRVVR